MSYLEDGIAALRTLADSISARAAAASTKASVNDYLGANEILNALLEENKAAEALISLSKKPRWRFQDLYLQLDTVRAQINPLLAKFSKTIAENIHAHQLTQVALERAAQAALLSDTETASTAHAEAALISAAVAATPAAPPAADLATTTTKPSRPGSVMAWSDNTAQHSSATSKVIHKSGARASSIVSSPTSEGLIPRTDDLTLPGEAPANNNGARNAHSALALLRQKEEEEALLTISSSAAVASLIRRRRHAPRPESLRKAAAGQHSDAVHALTNGPIETADTHIRGADVAAASESAAVTAELPKPPVAEPVAEMQQQPTTQESSTLSELAQPEAPIETADSPLHGTDAAVASEPASVTAELPQSPVAEPVAEMQQQPTTLESSTLSELAQPEAPIETADSPLHGTDAAVASEPASVTAELPQSPVAEPVAEMQQQPTTLESSTLSELAQPEAPIETTVAAPALPAAASEQQQEDDSSNAVPLGGPEAANAGQHRTATPRVSSSTPPESDDGSKQKNTSRKPAKSQERHRYESAYLACHDLQQRIPADTSDANKNKQLSKVRTHLKQLLAQVNYVGLNATNPAILNTLSGVLDDTCARMEGGMEHKAYQTRANAMQGHTNIKMQFIGGLMLLVGAALVAAGIVCPPLIGAGIAAAAVCGVLSAGFFYTGRKQGLSGAASALNNAWGKAGNPDPLPAEKPETVTPGF